MNYYNEIKNKLINEEIYSTTKDYCKEKHKVITYYETGELLAQAGKHYGEDIIGKYAKTLVNEVGRKYNKRNLFRIRQFYLVFSNKKLSQVATQLSWSHYIELLPLKDINEIIYYISTCKQLKLGRDALRKKIKSKEYERLPKETKKKLIKKEETNIKDLIPNPILIKNQSNIEVINEKILHQLILENIESFMEELGNSYSFIKSEYKIKIGDRYNYIDLLLYNYEFNCFIVIELKITELKKEHIGQIQVYMNYVDINLKRINQDKTIGIIICKKDNKFIMEYCSDERILARTYELI